MDCDTLGIEPDYSLVKQKLLAGGGSLKIVNRSVRPALERLHYSDVEIEEILEFLQETGTAEGAPHLTQEHQRIFQCAIAMTPEGQTISADQHLKMMAAAQPFLSGAMSKTVNLSESATVQDIQNIYLKAWRLGLKSIAIYRNNSKSSQPLKQHRLNEDIAKSAT